MCSKAIEQTNMRLFIKSASLIISRKEEDRGGDCEGVHMGMGTKKIMG
jgi:hypothetical protein